MDEEYFKCPTCGIGNLVSEIISDDPDGQIKTHYYTCGHQQRDITFHPVGVIHNMILESRIILKSGETTVRNKPKFEITERCAKDDFDNPGEPVENRIYINRKTSPPSVFHLTQYTSGKIKHLDCKTGRCSASYSYQTTEPLEDSFSIDLSSLPKIECLRCHAKFEQ